MKSRYAVEEENKTKEEDDYEENEDKEAQDLSNENEKKHDEEMKKAQDNDDDKNIDTGEDEDKKEDAEDEDKLDLTDKQKEFLRDSRLAKQVATLKAELKAMKAQIRTARLDPIINSILEAKSKLGKINADAEYAKLIRLDSATLHDLKANYDQLADSQNQPRYQVKYASVNSTSGDELLKTMRGDLR